MTFRTFHSLIILGFWLGGWTLHAVNLDNQMSQSYPEFQPGKDKQVFVGPSMNSQFPQQPAPKQLTFPQKSFNTTDHLQKRGPFSGANEQFALGNLYKTRTLSFDTKKFDMHRYNNRMSPLENLDTVRETVMAIKYSNAPHYQYPTATLQEIHGIVDQISMRDINRFQFRSNRSAEPGLEVQRAGDERRFDPTNFNTPEAESTSTRQQRTP